MLSPVFVVKIVYRKVPIFVYLSSGSGEVDYPEAGEVRRRYETFSVSSVHICLVFAFLRSDLCARSRCPWSSSSRCTPAFFADLHGTRRLQRNSATTFLKKECKNAGGEKRELEAGSMRSIGPAASFRREPSPGTIAKSQENGLLLEEMEDFRMQQCFKGCGPFEHFRETRTPNVLVARKGK